MKSSNSTEVLKCIVVGLLCVQGDPDDRPSMADAIIMLGSCDMTTLPHPKEPSVIPQKHDVISCSSSSSKLATGYTD